MIEWTVTSSALILLVLVLRAAVKDRVSPRLRYGLWGLVLVRLVIPVSLCESSASILCAAQASEGYQLVSTLPAQMSLYENGSWRSVAGPEGSFQMRPEEAGRWEGEQPRTYNAYGWVAVPSPEEAQALRDQGQKAVDNAALKRMVDLQNVLRAMWQVGVWLSVLFLAAVNGKFALALRQRRRPDGEYRGRPVFILDGLPTPCLFGLFQPAIYLTPETAVDETAREHVLAHEYAHFRQGDHAWAIWRGVCLALHWYNPLVWLAAVLSRRDCELSCDERAVRLLGEEHRADYGRTLVGLVTRKTAPADLLRCATTMTGGKSALKERIALLVRRPRTTAAMAVLVAAVCAGAVVCTFTGAAEAQETIPVEPPQEEQEGEPAEDPPESALQNRRLQDVPEDLPTDLMDLSRPAEEQGPWLLLAQTPGFDIALYRSAWDDQHVYLRVTNQSFQQFDRDLTGMELLPTLEVTEGEADLTVRALYRRYEGTYFNGTSYEPGIVAEQVFYDWDEAGGDWTEWTISTQPAQRLTEDLPALADLPGIFGISGERMDEPMWWIGEVRKENIRLYWAQYEGQMYLRYGEHIQRIEDQLECEWLPELYFEDLDGDGDRELLIHYTRSHGTGVYYDSIAVYEWDGQQWHGTRHEPDGVIAQFNRERIYQFYRDGTAFISYEDADLLLDLSDLWESGYWETAPERCELSRFNTRYTYENGQLTLTIAGELLGSGSPYLHGFAFDYVCPVVYTDYGDGQGYLAAWSGALRSEFAVEQTPPVLTDTYRAILAEKWAECDKNDVNVYAVHDVDGDGVRELIVRWMPEGAIGSAWGTSVYGAGGAEKFHGYGRLTFYSNGVISEPWSHNQGQASAIWSYRLYRRSGGGYTELGSVRAISSRMEQFPQSADLDGDGVVYYLGEDALTEEHAVDNAAYEAWRAEYLAGAEILPVRYLPLTEETAGPLA